MKSVMDGPGIVARIKSRHGIDDGAPVGVVAAWDTKAATYTEDGNYDIESTMTTSDVDLDEEVVLPEGGDLDSYLRKNGAVFLDHHYSTEKRIGHVRWIKTFPDSGPVKGLAFRAAVLKTSNSPLPGLVMDMARQFGIGASIGFIALDYGPPTPAEKTVYPLARSVVRKWKAIEVSFTALPCNVACQGRAVVDDSKSTRVLRVMGERAKLLGVGAPRKRLVVGL